MVELSSGKLFGIIFSSVLVFYGAYSLLSFKLHYRRLAKAWRTKPAPYVKTSFPLGIPTFWRLMKAKKESRLLQVMKEYIESMKRKTFVVGFFYKDIPVTLDPENIKAILATQFKDFELGDRKGHLNPLLGDGIFTLDGSGWSHSRALLRPQFSRDQVSRTEHFEKHVSRLINIIRNTKGQQFEIQDLFFRLTVDTGTDVLFGESVESLLDYGKPSQASIFKPTEDGKAEFSTSFNKSQEYLGYRAWAQFLAPLYNVSREFHQSNKNVHRFADFYVKKALELSPDELQKRTEGHYVFLYELSKVTRDPLVLRSQLLNILLAARDTTAATLTFTIMSIAREPKVLAKLRAEVLELFGDGSDLSKITFESLKKASYLHYVINEVLRLYPPVPLNFRVANKDTTLPRGGGEDESSPFLVKKGETVAYFIYFVHRNKEYYGDDADQFRPERWADNKGRGWEYLPFNGGPRICLGQQLALTETAYVIVRLLQTFPNLVNCDSYPLPPLLTEHITLSHGSGVHVKLY